MHLRSRGKESCTQRLKDVTRRTASLSGWRGWPPVYAWLTFLRVNEWVRSKREACCSASVVIMAAARAISSVHSWVFLARERERCTDVLSFGDIYSDSDSPPPQSPEPVLHTRALIWIFLLECFSREERVWGKLSSSCNCSEFKNFVMWYRTFLSFFFLFLNIYWLDFVRVYVCIHACFLFHSCFLYFPNIFYVRKVL